MVYLINPLGMIVNYTPAIIHKVSFYYNCRVANYDHNVTTQQVDNIYFGGGSVWLIKIEPKTLPGADPINKISSANLMYSGLEHSDWFKTLAQRIRMLQWT